MKLPEEFTLLFGKDILAQQYRGKLTTSEASNLINAIITNALDLCNDSTLLFENGRFSRSLSLSNLAIEEMGKIFIVLKILMASDKSEFTTAWSEFVSHREKNYTWLFPLLDEMRSEISIEKYIKLVDSKGYNSLIPHQLKMNGFYVGVDSKRNPIKPSSIDKTLAFHFLETAITVSTQDIIWKDEACLNIYVKYQTPPDSFKGQIGLYTELADKKLITRMKANKILANIESIRKAQ